MAQNAEPISIRLTRLNNILQGRTLSDRESFGKEGLLDALFVLYDECDHNNYQNNTNVNQFIQRYKPIVSEYRRLRPSPNDFSFIRVIGRGQFGTVTLNRENASGQCFAIKTIKKGSPDIAKQTMLERQALGLASQNNIFWFPKLHMAIQDAQSVYLVMDFLPGGDMLTLLDRSGGFLEQSAARFYLAELSQALHILHSRLNFVHRDVKPSNLLLDRCGHLRLCDLGSAARLVDNRVTKQAAAVPVGTPEYLAPELLAALEANKDNPVLYGPEVDFWGVGIVAFEFVHGFTPFSEEDPDTTILAKLYSRIQNAQEIDFPDDSAASEIYRDFILGLLKNDGAQRLNFESIRAHNLLSDIGWTELTRSVPPHLPVVTAEDDSSNFPPPEPIPRGKNRINVNSFAKDEWLNQLPYVGFTWSNLSLSPWNNVDASGDAADHQTHQKITRLKNQLLSKDKLNKNLEDMEIKLEQETKHLKLVQNERNQLEQNLIQTKSLIVKLETTLNFEREERKAHEAKAISIIRDNRAKLQRRLDQQIQAETEKIAQISEIKNELEGKLAEKEKEIAKLKQNLLDHSHNLSRTRGSISGIESRYDQMMTDSRTRIKNLLKELEEERKKCSKLTQVVEEERSSAKRLSTELNVSMEKRSSIEALANRLENLLAENARETAALRAQINESENLRAEELQQLKSKNQELQKRLIEQTNKTQSTQISLDKISGELTEKAARLEENLKYLTNENVQLREELNNQKTPSQEMQKEEITGQLRALAQEFSVNENLQKDLAKAQRDLSSAQLNERIVRREAKQNEEDKNRWYERFKEERKRADTQKEQLDEIKSQLDTITETLNLSRSSEKIASTKVTELESKIKSLEGALTQAQNECAIHKERIKTLELESKKESNRANKSETEQKHLESKLKLETEKVKELEKNVSVLKETCVMLDGQLEDMDKLITKEEKQNEELKETNQNIEKQLSQANQTIFEKRKQITDMENEMEALKTELTLAKQDLDTEQRQREGFQQMAQQLTEQITELETSRKDKEKDFKTLKRSHEQSLIENNQLREQASRHLTQLHGSRETNEELNEQTETLITQLHSLTAKYAELQVRSEEQNAFFQDQAIKQTETIQQQSKLIHFMQEKLQSLDKKKKILGNLFGPKSNKEANTQPSSRSEGPSSSSSNQQQQNYRVQAKAVLENQGRIMDIVSKQNKEKAEASHCNKEKGDKLSNDTLGATWLDALQNKNDKTSVTKNLPFKTVIAGNKFGSTCIEINCCYHLSPQLLLLGTHEGLYSLRLAPSGSIPKRPEPIQIKGVFAVHQIECLSAISIGLLLIEESMTIVQCCLRQLKNSAESAECSAPYIDTACVMRGNSGGPVLHFAAATSRESGMTFLCLALASSSIQCLVWTPNYGGVFEPTARLDTVEPCTSLRFTSNCDELLAAADRFYRIDLCNFCIQGWQKAKFAESSQSYPLAIFPLEAEGDDAQEEYLLCTSVLAVRIHNDSTATPKPYYWKHVPIAFAFRDPYLVVVHFASVEVLRITSSSSKPLERVRCINRLCGGLRLLSTSSCSGNVLNEPVYLSLASSLVSLDPNIVDTLSADEANEEDGEFSFTDSMLDSLDSDSEK